MRQIKEEKSKGNMHKEVGIYIIVEKKNIKCGEGGGTPYLD
jgi:hypothetical protein